MFCTVKRKKNKYAVYLSERVREDGKVKSKDKYIFTLEAQEIENGAYEERLTFSSLTEEEKKLIIRKLGNMEVTLHDTTNKGRNSSVDKSLHDTARIEIEVADNNKVIEYKFYVEGVLVVKFDSVDFEHSRLYIISRVFVDECKAKGLDIDSKPVDEISDTIFDLWEYHQDIKAREDKVRQEAYTYYENTIFALQMKIAELQSNSSRTLLHTTTDPMKVKKIYRALASKLHPDNGGSDELMQMLNELKNMIN